MPAGRSTCVRATLLSDLALGKVLALEPGHHGRLGSFWTSQPGSVVGSYRIEKEIGRGGMGKVYKATHTVLPRKAAIKIMHPELCRHPGMATRMVQEAAILEDVRHPGLVRVFECNILPDYRPFIAMEFVEGDTLTQRLGQSGRMAVARRRGAARAISPTCSTRSTSAASSIATSSPTTCCSRPAIADFPLRLIDWGVARLGPVGRLTMEGMTPGTPIYMSPEQAAGQHIAAPCDIYSLGVIAYEALTGQPPFDGRTLAEVVCKHITTKPVPLTERCSAPAELCELVHRMLDKDPAVRPMAVDIRRICREMIGSSTRSPRATTTSRSRSCRRADNDNELPDAGRARARRHRAAADDAQAALDAAARAPGRARRASRSRPAINAIRSLVRSFRVVFSNELKGSCHGQDCRYGE